MKKEVLIYFTGKLIPALVNLAIIVLAVRLLGKEEYGKFTLIFNSAMMFCTLTFGWIQQSILRFLTATPLGRETLLGRFRLMAVISALLALVLGFGLGTAYFGLAFTDSLILAGFMFLFNLYSFHLTLQQADRRSARYAVMEGTYHTIYLLLFLLMVYLTESRSFRMLFLAMLAGLAMSESIRILSRRESPSGEPAFGYDRSFTRQVISYGFPVTLWLFLSNFMTITDRFVIREVTGYEAVGAYSAVKDLVIKLATFTTLPVLLAFHPAIVEQWNKGNPGEATRLKNKGLAWILTIAAGASILFLAFSQVLYERFLHISVEQDLAVTLLLLVSSFLWQAAMLWHKPLELMLRPGLMLVAIVTALAVNIAANVVFMPLVGFVGSAAASLAAVIVYFLMVTLMIRKTSGRQNAGMTTKNTGRS